MALDRIRQLSAHEIGHTLGIAHNFSASVKERASVMDYPHPLVGMNDQGELDISKGYATGMGEWDTQVIKYGYSDFTASDEAQALAAILAENKSKGLEFISDADARPKGGAHPTAHLWDNGNDPAAELTRVLDIRQKALARFGLNNIKTGEALSQLEEKLVPLYLFHRYQVESAVKLIGGVDYDYEVRGAHTPKGAQVVGKAKQQAALAALLDTLAPEQLMIPESVLALIPPKAYGEYKTRESVKGRTGLTLDAMALPEVAAQHTLSLLLNPERLNRLAQQGARNRGNLSSDDLLNTVYQHVFQPKAQPGMATKLAQRVQFLTAYHLATLSSSDKLAPEVQAQSRFYLNQLVEQYSNDSLFGGASKADAFETYLADQVAQYLKSGKWPQGFKALPMPPGSPI